MSDSDSSESEAEGLRACTELAEVVTLMTVTLVQCRRPGRCLFPGGGLHYTIMIWLRRVLSIPVGIVFFVLLLLTLVLLQISNSFLNPDYYPEQLRKADIYEFVLNDLLTSAIDERREQEREKRDAAGTGQSVTSTPLLSSGLSTEQIVSAVNRAVPPEWAQELVEQSFDEIGRYLTGERDQFAFTLSAGDRVDTLVEEFKSLIRSSDAYEVLFQEVITPEIKKAVAKKKLPLGVEFTTERLVQAARPVVPSEWVQEQVEMVLDELTPYFVGDRDTFEINLPLADRAEIALGEVKSLLRETDFGELLYTEVVEPQLFKSLGQAVQLPLGVAITNEEVLSALRQVSPPSWVEEQALMLIDEASPYLTGKADSFSAEVSLVENKRLARDVISELVDTKVKEAVESIPKCETLAEARAALSAASQGLPSCVPANISVTQLLDRLDIDLAGAIQSRVLSPIPDSITFTESQLRTSLVQAGAGENLEQVDEVRRILNEGWTYTQVDLRVDVDKAGDILGKGATERLEDIRDFLADGWTYTETDLFEDVAAAITSRRRATTTATTTPEEVKNNLDEGRDLFKASRTYRWVIFIPLIVLLAGFGFLGGRGWSGRVVWAAAFLLVSAGIIFLILGPAYDRLVEYGESDDPSLEELSPGDLLRLTFLSVTFAFLDENELVEDNEFPQTTLLAANKAVDIVVMVADDFASGIAGSSLKFAIIGLVALLATIFRSTILGAARRVLPSRGQDPPE